MLQNMICPHCKYKISDGLENCSVCGKSIIGNDTKKEKEPENEDVRFSLGARNRLKDYYQILGLEHNCTESEIKIAYKKLVIKFHPDKNQGDKFFLEMFKDVQEAYDVLSDPAKRNAYNAKLEAQTPYERPTYRQPTYSEPSKPRYEHKETPKDDDYFDPVKKFIFAILSRFGGLIILFLFFSILGFISDCSGCSSGSSRSKYKPSKTYTPPIEYTPLYSSETMYKSSSSTSSDNSKTPVNLDSIFKKIDEDNKKIIEKQGKLDKKKIKEDPLNLFVKRLKTGDSPYDNYFGKGIYDKNYYNKLEIKNGNNADVIVCLTEYYTKRKRTIRNEYIRAGETFEMTNIPNGTYIIKTISGKDWNPDKVMFNGKIKGGFNYNENFSISDRKEDLLFMNQRNVEDGIRYSAHTITLYKVKDGNMESRNINDMDFFNED